MASLSRPNVARFVGFAEDMEKGDTVSTLGSERKRSRVSGVPGSGEWDIPEHLSLIEAVANSVEYYETASNLPRRPQDVGHPSHGLWKIGSGSRYRGDVDPKTGDGGSEPPRWEVIDDIVRGLLSPKIKFNRPALRRALTEGLRCGGQPLKC